MKSFEGFDLRQWLWAAAVTGAISPVVLAQAPSKPGLQAPARLGPQSARPIQQVAGTAPPQRNNPMRPAAPVQISTDPNAPKSDIQRQLELIYEQNGMEAPNMNLQLTPIQPGGAAATAPGQLQPPSAHPGAVAQRAEEQSGNRFTGFFKKLVGGGDNGPKPTPAGKQAPGLSNASAPSPQSAPPMAPPVVDGLFDDSPSQPTVQAPAQPAYQPPVQPQYRSQPQYQPAAQPQYRTQPQYQARPNVPAQPQYRQPYATQPQQQRPQYTAQPTYAPRALPQQPGQPARLPAASAAPLNVARRTTPLLPMTPESGLPPAPALFMAAGAAEPTTLGTPAFLPAATTKAQPIVMADPAEQFAEPLRIAAEPTPSVAPRTRIAMAGPRIPAAAAPREQGPALALPPAAVEPDKLSEASPADDAPTTVNVDPFGDFEDPFTEMSESEADGRGKTAPRAVASAPAESQPAAAPALTEPTPVLAAPALAAPVPAAEPAPSSEFTAAKSAPALNIDTPREDGAPILLPAPLETAAPLSDEAMEEDDEDPFEAELNDDGPDVKRSIRRSSDSQPALAVPQLAAKPATPALTKDAPVFEAPVDLAPAPSIPLSAPKLSDLNPLLAPRNEKAETSPAPKPEVKVAERAAQPLPPDSPELTPVPQLQLDPDSTKSKMERIRERSGTVGLKGFCPVKLRDQRELVDAQPGYEALYRGQKFLFSDIESRAKFEQNPTRYAPAAYGADVVALLRDKNVVEGTLDYAAWYKGRLYLFGSQASHDTFVEKPEDFADGESIE